MFGEASTMEDQSSLLFAVGKLTGLDTSLE